MDSPQVTHLLIRTQEIALKGGNRFEFETRLKRNIKKALQPFEIKTSVEKLSDRLVIPVNDAIKNSPRYASILKNISRVAGIVSVNPCAVESIEKFQLSTGVDWSLRDFSKKTPKTFSFQVRRVNKKFPIGSAALEKQLFDKLQENLGTNTPKLQLKAPEHSVKVEVRKSHVLIYSDGIEGRRGLPTDHAQRIVCLLSGGIDSPVAALEMMNRGCTPIFVHFHSMPFTSEASLNKVRDLAKALRKYSPHSLELWLVPILNFQRKVRDICNQRYRTIHYRRFMFKCAELLATRIGAQAIVTGDALGQVASQTLQNIRVVEDGISLPVLRPLISLDKDKIVARAKEAETYAISIQPHDDSCILFAPKNPATQAKLEHILWEQESLPMFEMAFEALDSAEKIVI